MVHFYRPTLKFWTFSFYNHWLRQLNIFSATGKDPFTDSTFFNNETVPPKFTDPLPDSQRQTEEVKSFFLVSFFNDRIFHACHFDDWVWIMNVVNRWSSVTLKDNLKNLLIESGLKVFTKLHFWKCLNNLLKQFRKRENPFPKRKKKVKIFVDCTASRSSSFGTFHGYDHRSWSFNSWIINNFYAGIISFYWSLFRCFKALWRSLHSQMIIC